MRQRGRPCESRCICRWDRVCCCCPRRLRVSVVVGPRTPAQRAWLRKPQLSITGMSRETRKRRARRKPFGAGAVALSINHLGTAARDIEGGFSRTPIRRSLRCPVMNAASAHRLQTGDRTPHVHERAYGRYRAGMHWFPVPYVARTVASFG